MKNEQFEKISQEKFQFVQMDGQIHDKKFETKARSYMQDAIFRFSKNKSSVIAAWILLFLLIFTVVSPMISGYTLDQKDNIYINTPPFVPAISKLNIGVLNGATKFTSQNEAAMNYWAGIAKETGYDPLIKILDSKTELVKYRGKMVERSTHTIELNRYYQPGIIYRTMSVAEFNRLQDWQNETGIQVIYPYVETKDICDIDDNPNIWYECDAKGAAKLDSKGNFVPVYSTRTEMEGAPYYSQRIEGDPGNYIYSFAKAGSIRVRVCYYNYYQYLNGKEPSYVFGTDALGRDLFTAIGKGARFSLLFAVAVSAINIFLGVMYGSAQGYYGGWVDMLLDRIGDVLYYVPFTVVTTLFQLHLAQKVGPIWSFLFAFVLTGWLSISGLTRKQFYRFKSLEFVMSARTLGASDGRLMFKHILPNGLGTMITSCALIIPGTIGSETQMTYLGIVDLNSYVGATLGTLMSSGQASMTTAPHAMLWPSVFFALLMISFNLFSNGLRDAFNPSTRGAED